jgi:DNA-binding transcriptional LysR family regulator
MDIDRVRYFNVFAETGSLVKASEVLHISQPALSKALRLLESETGLKLLEAEGRGLRLTADGQRFRAATGKMLRDWLSIPKHLRDQTNWNPTKLGSFEVFTTYFLSHLVEHVGLEALEIHEFGPGRLEEAIAAGTADIGITYVPVPTAGVEFTEVTRVKMGVFGVQDKFAEMEFKDLPFVIPLHPAEGTPSKVIGLDGWPDHRFERLVKFRVTMMESALELCRKGHAVAYLPEFVVQMHNEDLLAPRRLSQFECPISQKDRQQSVFLVQRKASGESKLFRQIAKCLRSLK